MPDPILITGCARSGTSMVAGIIDRCGAFGGHVLGPTPANRRGQYENRTVTDTLVKPYLKRMGADPMGQAPLPNPDQLQPYPELRGQVQSVFKAHGYAGGPWYFKGAKLCLVYPVWRDAFPEAKWVVVRRRDDDIVASCMRTGFMRAYRDHAGWQHWVNHHKICFEAMMEDPDCNACEIWPHEFVYGDFSALEMLADWLGLPFAEGAVRDFVHPSLYTSTAGG